MMRSLQKLAMAMASMAGTTADRVVEKTRKAAAPAKPVVDMMRRAHVRLRSRRRNHPRASTEAGLPKPPKKSGRMPSHAVAPICTWRASRR